MQVSHAADHVTHAVMGSNESIELSVTDSADFMIMMSSTLYTNQPLAVVREVVCNAWDAHIEAGVTDQAIRITLENDTLTIRDFGRGIAHEQIGPVYGTYGQSTKKHDGMQTGGFGLGCKAPFAYVEHFQVTSYHAGTKTIYTMSKSSAQVGGKPAINKIVALPTTETGLEVSLKVRPQDVNTFRKYLYRIVRNGEMKATLNGDDLPVLPFSQAKHNFLVLTESPTGEHTRLFLRYGNVIYPIPSHESLEVQAIERFLDSLPQHPVIVFQAPPHSISVTPSREALSMKEQTLATLQGLISDFKKLLSRHLRIEVVKVFDNGLAQAVTQKLAHKVLTPKREIPFLVPGHMSSAEKHLSDMPTLAKFQASHQYPQLSGFRRMEVRKRIQAAVAMGAISRPLAHTFLVEYRKDAHRKRQSDYHGNGTLSSWFLRRIVAPLAQGLIAAGLPASHLWAVGHGHNEGSYSRRVDRDGIVPALSARRLPMSHYMLYLRQLVVLSHKRDPLDDLTGSSWPKDSQRHGFLNYVVPVSAKRIEATRAFFATTGMTVIDLLDDPDAIRERTANRLRVKEKKIGILRGDGALDSSINWYNAAETRLEASKPRITDPQWVAKAAAKDRSGNWEPISLGWDAETTTAFLRLFGKMGGFYTTVTQTKKMKAVSPMVYAVRKTTEYIMQSQALKQFFYLDPARDDGFRFDYGQYELQDLYRAILNNPALRQHFGMPYELSALDQEYLTLWRRMERREHQVLMEMPETKPFFKYLKTLPLHPQRFVLKQLLADRADVLELLDLDKIRKRLNHDDPAVQAHVIKVLLTTLEG